MRNTWLIIRREYWERVRTKSFLLSTLLLPVLMAAAMILPGNLAMLKRSKTKHVAVVCSDDDFARAVASQLATGRSTGPSGATYEVSVVTTPSETTRAELKRKVAAGDLDGFLWLNDDALKSRRIGYVALDTNDFIGMASLRSALKGAFVRQRLLSRGATSEEADEALAGITLDTVTIEGGKEKRAASGPERLISVIILAMMQYTTLLMYGITVMRSVLEEKTSRVMEVMLSSVTPRELMAGKILGVGAVGLTQTLAWAILGVLVFIPGLAVVPSLLRGVQISPNMILAFVVFFILGYLLYSGLFAALGAMVNSEQEAQHWQIAVMIPLVVPLMMMTYIIREPNSPTAVWMSVIPFFAPILMYLRIVVQAPPVWQIGLSIALTLAAMWGVLVLCSRIYRIGVLMYGKKPTLPELMKWARYT